MSRQPSAETQLRTERSKSRKLAREVVDLREQLGEMRHHALTAQRELAEWKTRFDLLLAKENKQ